MRCMHLGAVQRSRINGVCAHLLLMRRHVPVKIGIRVLDQLRVCKGTRIAPAAALQAGWDGCRGKPAGRLWSTRWVDGLCASLVAPGPPARQFATEPLKCTALVDLEAEAAAAARLPGGIGCGRHAVSLAHCRVDPSPEPPVCRQQGRAVE